VSHTLVLFKHVNSLTFFWLTRVYGLLVYIGRLNLLSFFIRLHRLGLSLSTEPISSFHSLQHFFISIPLS
jgi:hypothetical protein